MFAMFKPHQEPATKQKSKIMLIIVEIQNYLDAVKVKQKLIIRLENETFAWFNVTSF